MSKCKGERYILILLRDIGYWSINLQQFDDKYHGDRYDIINAV